MISTEEPMESTSISKRTWLFCFSCMALCVMKVLKGSYVFHFAFGRSHHLSHYVKSKTWEGINTNLGFLVLLHLFFNILANTSLAWFFWLGPSLKNTEIKWVQNYLHGVSKSSSYPLHFGLKIWPNTSQTLTDKNHSLLQELGTIFWFQKRKPKPFELHPLTANREKTTHCSAYTHE